MKTNEVTDTPETDSKASPHIGFYSCETVPADLARRLECERDDAERKIKELIYIASRALELADLDFENDKFGVVSELRENLELIEENTKLLEERPPTFCLES